MEPHKITVIVPAYNEERYIGRVLGPIKKWQSRDPKNREFVVVNDGSTDKTPAVAERYGAKVIYSNPKDPKVNLGKAHAIKAGLMHAKKSGSSVLVTLDADTNKLKPEQIETMVDELRANKCGMVIGRVKPLPGFERFDEHTTEANFYSGERAFDIMRLEPWVKGKPKWETPLKGFGFEMAMNHLIPGGMFSEVTFETDFARKKMKGRDTADIWAAHEFFRERRRRAAELMRKRGAKQPSRARAKRRA